MEPIYQLELLYTNEGSETAHVLTICVGRECLVVQLFRGDRPLSRDVTVFLRDVCTCYGWRSEAYGDLLVRRHPLLSLGRLTDIQTLVPNGQYMGLGDFSMVAFGRRVPEKTVTNWTKRQIFKNNQIRETVMEAYVCQVLGMMNADAAPPNDSLSRVIATDFPQISETRELADRKVFRVYIDTNKILHVTYTTRAAVLTSWLRSLRGPGLFGVDVTHNHRGRLTVMAFAFGTECLAYNLYEGEESAGCLVSSTIFNLFQNSNGPFVCWNTREQVLESINFGLRPERVIDVKDEFPRTHSYDDLARLVLGYEMPKLITVGIAPADNEIMDVAVQAHVCLMGGLHFGYENRHW